MTNKLMTSDWSALPKTVADARAVGARYYFDGRPCKKEGHIAPRRTRNTDCYQCMLDGNAARAARKWEEGRPAREAAVTARKAARDALRAAKALTPEQKRAKARAARQAWLHRKLREVGTETYFGAEAAKARAVYWANPEKARARRRERGRRGLAGHRLYALRTPPWLSEQELKAIEAFCENCPPGYEVEHIIPFVGRKLAGLHTLGNLRYMKSRPNKQKSNHWAGTEADMLDEVRFGHAVFPFDVSATGEIAWERYRDL